MISPFTSPPPPYSPQHPHIILDHEKIPRADIPPPPHSAVAPAAHASGTMTSDSAPSIKPRGLRGEEWDIFHLPPTTALILLSRSIELLVSLTGDVPPSPPPSDPSTPEAESDLEPAPPPSVERDLTTGFCFGSAGPGEVDGVIIKRRSSKEDNKDEASENGGKSVVDSLRQSQQYGAITRKFWCRTAPEIPIEDYLFRIHRYCPLSTAVYLAASLYLHRLAVTERVIPITRLNVHRLLLAALRVASKGLEDLSYPHKRFAKVGGLSESELSKLEVSFCFLMNFDLKVDRRSLEKQVIGLRQIVSQQVVMGTSGLVQPHLPSPPKGAKSSTEPDELDTSNA
ncbi:hypothetical protein RUND412_010380 [Rhizina undulata]